MAADKTKRPPKLRAVPATPARADFQFTPAEMRLVRAYRQINDECQRTYLHAMEEGAENGE